MSLFEGRKFLVVEDDEMLREVLCDVLRFAGAQVTEAQNGVIAFTLVKNGDFDLVLSDVRMPGGDGISLAKNISELSGKKPTVCICSGYSDISKEEAAKFNIAKIFEKPFDRKVLIYELSSLLS